MARRHLFTLATEAIARLVIRRENTALLVQDMQMYWADREGGYARVAAERGILYEYNEYFQIIDQMRANILHLIDRFHQLRMPVIFTSFAYEDERDISALQLGTGIVLPSEDAEAQIISDLAPTRGEPLYVKTGFSAFASGGFSDHLQRRRIENLILTGVHSEMGIWATALSAQDRGIRPLLVSDGCAGLCYDAHDNIMARAPHALTKVRSTGELMDSLRVMEQDDEPVLI